MISMRGIIIVFNMMLNMLTSNIIIDYMSKSSHEHITNIIVTIF